MNTKILSLYRKFRLHSPVMLVGRDAELCLSYARTLARFSELEDAGLVRMRSEPEADNYFDVYGTPDSEKERKAIEATLERMGCWYVCAEALNPESGEWELADGVGMCVYDDPESPFENCYVPEMMSAAVELAERFAREPAERAHWEARDTITTEGL